MNSESKKSVLTATGSSPPGLFTSNGFTLVELIVICAILGILSMLSLRGLTEFKEKAKIARCSGEIRSLEKEISAFALEKGTLPLNLADIHRDGLRDPWGNAFVYKPYVLNEMRYSGAETLNTDFDLYSKGSDGLTALSINDDTSRDDIFRANDGGFAGPESKF